MVQQQAAGAVASSKPAPRAVASVARSGSVQVGDRPPIPEGAQVMVFGLRTHKEYNGQMAQVGKLAARGRADVRVYEVIFSDTEKRQINEKNLRVVLGRVQLLKALFRQLDTRNVGKLGQVELHSYAAKCGFESNQAPWEAEYQDLASKYGFHPDVGAEFSHFEKMVDDQDGSGYCETHELCELLAAFEASAAQKAARAALVTALFRQLDTDGSGYLNQAKLQRLVEHDPKRAANWPEEYIRRCAALDVEDPARGLSESDFAAMVNKRQGTGYLSTSDMHHLLDAKDDESDDDFSTDGESDDSSEDSATGSEEGVLQGRSFHSAFVAGKVGKPVHDAPGVQPVAAPLSVRDPAGHELVELTTSVQGFRCRDCGVAQPAGVRIRSCGLCHYDLCEACAAKAATCPPAAPPPLPPPATPPSASLLQPPPGPVAAKAAPALRQPTPEAKPAVGAVPAAHHAPPDAAPEASVSVVRRHAAAQDHVAALRAPTMQRAPTEASVAPEDTPAVQDEVAALRAPMMQRAPTEASAAPADALAVQELRRTPVMKRAPTEEAREQAPVRAPYLAARFGPAPRRPPDEASEDGDCPSPQRAPTEASEAPSLHHAPTESDGAGSDIQPLWLEEMVGTLQPGPPSQERTRLRLSTEIRPMMPEEMQPRPGARARAREGISLQKQPTDIQPLILEDMLPRPARAAQGSRPQRGRDPQGGAKPVPAPIHPLRSVAEEGDRVLSVQDNGELTFRESSASAPRLPRPTPTVPAVLLGAPRPLDGEEAPFLSAAPAPQPKSLPSQQQAPLAAPSQRLASHLQVPPQRQKEPLPCAMGAATQPPPTSSMPRQAVLMARAAEVQRTPQALPAPPPPPAIMRQVPTAVDCRRAGLEAPSWGARWIAGSVSTETPSSPGSGISQHLGADWPTVGSPLQEASWSALDQAEACGWQAGEDPLSGSGWSSSFETPGAGWVVEESQYEAASPSPDLLKFVQLPRLGLPDHFHVSRFDGGHIISWGEQEEPEPSPTRLLQRPLPVDARSPRAGSRRLPVGCPLADPPRPAWRDPPLWGQPQAAECLGPMPSLLLRPPRQVA